MNANSVIFLLAFCAILSIEELHAQDAQNTNHQEPKRSQVEQSELDRQPFQGPEFSSNGKPFFLDALLFVARVDLNKISGLFIDDKQLNDPSKLTDEQKNLIWFRVSEELPAGTNFYLRVSSISENRNAGIKIGIEEAEPSFDIEKNDFILIFAVAPFQYNNKPRLDYHYVDFEKWNKDSGYFAAKKKIESKYIKSTEITFLIQELTDENGGPDEQAYSTFLQEAGLAKSTRQMVILANGQRALAKIVTLSILDKLYRDPRVINIVPNLKNE